jgi:molybdopterin molybdotransferase
VTPLAAAEAACRILEHVRRQPPLRTPLDDALGSVLAEDIVSPLDVPPWTNSAMDGYAARAEDVRGASQARPVHLRVIERIPAGHFPVRTIGPGECARIFTGAALPPGADSVIRQEDTDGGVDRVAITTDRDVTMNIRLAGEDIAEGTTVLGRGTALRAAQMGVLASLGMGHVMVYRRPRVAILASGDEIVDVDQAEEILAGRKIASSNTHTLTALVREAGGIPVNLGIARDTPESVREHLERAAEADLLITSAGISVGEHDYLREVLHAMGADLKFWRLRMRPGAPVGFGLLGPVPWIGLPGNPVSTMVTFELFVRPAIRKMSGQGLPFRRAVRVTMDEPIALKPKLQHFLRALVTDDREGLRARLTGPQGSGILMSMVDADALLMIPEGQHTTSAGDQVDALVLTDPRHQAEPPF